MNRLTLRQLNVFMAVARHCNLGQAAEELALTRAAVSQSLQELEKQLGVQLFDRQHPHLRLNANGASLLPMADELLLRAREVEALFRAPEKLPATLRLGASSTIGSYLLPKVVARLRETYPDLRLAASVLNSAQLVAGLQQLTLDVVLMEGECLDPALTVRPWRRDELWLIAPAGHPLAQCEGLPVTALERQTWVIREPGSSSRAQFEQLIASRLTQWQVGFELNASAGVIQAVAAGLGLALVSADAAAALLASGQICRLQLAQPLSRMLNLVTLRSRYLPPQLVRMLDDLVRLGDLPDDGLTVPDQPLRTPGQPS
ncbi:LysR substrate-binding domain-containing protein [Laribacter hongkongensis]|uniref:Transcriptional regulator, LysR family protein n=1 Tax=Laribacter hongkongensis TaxID=168471 RepID=A0A248LI70_9NEIS|nr:LysR substrate-binding domain-containing protein [Laribacter hongkongensis]ASJ24457.1 transcriptional regulator, LysR family protein [Laribacter hongkongensis]MCG9040270.1 LysR family transcriptional regulator [Laribacter hongkongensis]MCG9068330.1 LysR family transcriptional regulator [Laribacter hongkongensis]MCG9088253.1 LysR family transcriptional regulator [Laribacter hongkongensis]MCG9108576.1 LysR family transcriptional regulator [Laribacter hongkongensis]